MLTPKQRKCIELMLSGEFTQKEIAKQIKVTEQAISGWKKNTEFMGTYDSLLRQCIRSLAARAFQTMSHLLNSKQDMVRMMAAKDILDRAGFKPDDNVNISVDPVVIVNDLKE